MGGCCCSCSKHEIDKEEKEEEKQVEKKSQRWEEEEEAAVVKEVLSETPKIKPKLLAPSSPDLKPPPLSPPPEKIPPSDDRSREQPQPSDDACSLSELSNATSAAPAETQRQLIPRRANANANANAHANATLRSSSAELLGARGGSRRDRSSPAVVAGVGCRSGRTSPGPPLRNRSSSSPSSSGNGNFGVKRGDADAGERSGRRSLSPAAKRKGEAVRRVPPMLMPSPSPSPLPPQHPRKAMPTPAPMPVSESDRGGGPAPERPPGANKECLENPSVSLECFIFL